MADIRLAKPAAGASESVQCAPDARFVFDFPTTDATLARDGDNLNIKFEDGSQLELQGFYQEYNGDNLPSFNIDGTEVAAADFFQAMNEPDLMPAAGPGTGTVANGARFHEWGDSALTGGILHLDGLDWGFSRAFEWDDVPNAVGRNGDDWGLLYSRGEGGSEPGAPAPGNTVPELNTPPAPEPPLDPEHPGDDPGKPVGPGNPGGYVPSANGASIVVDEGALAGGSGQHVLHGASGTGAFVADVHAERGGSIVLTHGGQSLTLAIPEDGATAITVPQGTPHTFTNVNGVDITILGATSDGAGKWTVNYEYTLAGRVEHDKATHDTTLFDARGVAITVTDGSGDVTTGRLTVEVHDDVPQFSVESTGEATSLAGSFGLNFGADAAAATGALTAAGATETAVEGATTHLTFAEGTLSITSEGGNEFSYIFTPSAAYDNLEFSKDITLTATDGDRDTDTTTITVGQEKAPTITTTTGGNVTGGKIIVDEGAMANGTRDHAEHGITDSGSFTVDMHGENGSITVSDGTEQGTVTITIEDGVASGEGTLHVNGVDVEITGATLNDTHWTVNYTYTLTENVRHEDDTTSGASDSTSGKLYITARDDDEGSEPARAELSVEVHDDGPKLTEVKVSDASEDVKDHSLYIDDAAETISIELDGMKFGADMEGTDSAGNPVVANVVLSVAYDEITKTATFTMQDGELKCADGDSELNYQGGKFIFTRPEDHYKAGNNQNDEYTFTAKITDSDGDHVEKSVTVSTNHTPDILTPGDDPEPVAKEQKIGGASITVDESGLDNDDYEGTSPDRAKTVDNTHTFKLDTHGEGGTVKFSFLPANKETAGAEYKLGTDDSVEEFAEKSFHTDHGVFTITGIKDGVVSYKYELTSPARTEGDNKAESHEAEQIKVTLTDNEHADQTSAYIAVNIKDDMPDLSSHSYSQSLEAGESVTSLNFATHTGSVSSAPTAFKATDGWSDMMSIGIKANDGGIDWGGRDHTYMGSNQGVLIIPTHVVYEYDDAGNFTVGVQNDIHYTMEGVAKNTLLSNKHLALGPNGLTVGTADKVGGVTGFDADEISVFTTGGASEALSFENNDPFYGITIKFGGLEGDYDKAVLAFYLTPKNSNDDRVVKIVEVTADMLDNGTYTAEVPDGFTKLIVSAAPTTAGQETVSGFGILSLDFKKNTQNYDGQVEFTAGADGLGAVTWDWSASGLDNAQVEILNIVGGKYKVNLEGDNTVTAKLVALSQDAKEYDGHVLFEGTLDSQTGQWHLTQNYKFQVYKDNEKQDAIFDVTFKVSDGEGDTATLPASIDLSKPMYLDRFDSMDKGFWNDTWGSNNGWKDHAADYILGGEDNSLIYGNGGDDLLFGDGDGALANLKTQLGTSYTFTENLTDVAAEKGGPNEDKIKELWNKVAALSEQQLLGLQEAIERGAGSGDDALFGGLGNDLLLGGAGNDYFEGNGKRPADWESSTGKTKWASITDKDIILAGSGEDIIVYDANDRLIDGGKGTDILLAGDKEQKLSLKNILSNTDTQKVYRVEVLLKSIKSDHIDKFGITSHASLLLYGIVLGENGMALDVGVWELVEDTEDYLTYRNTANDGPGTLEIQTTLGDDHVQLVAKDELGTMTTDNGGVDTLGLVPEDDGGTEPGSGAQLFAMRPSAPADENEGDAGHAAPAPAAGAAATGGKNLIEGDEDEPNTLVGTDGDDVIIGGSAGDFIDGGAGSDTIYAGAGDDLIVYDATDYLIDGGEGIDFLLSGSADPAHSLADMLGNWAQNGADKGMPMVHDVEVMLKGVDTSLQNMDSLAREYGFSMDKDANGRDILVLDKDKWALDESQSGNGTNTYVNAESGITLETTLTETATGATDAGEHAAQTIVLTSNG